MIGLKYKQEVTSRIGRGGGGVGTSRTCGGWGEPCEEVELEVAVEWAEEMGTKTGMNSMTCRKMVKQKGQPLLAFLRETEKWG